MNEAARIVLSMKPLLLGFKILGIFGCGISHDRVRVSSWKTRFYPIIWIVLSASSFVRMKNGDDESIVVFRGDSGSEILRKIANFFTLTSDMFVAVFQQRRIVEFFEKVDAYDRRLIDVGFARRDDDTTMLVYSAFLAVPGFMIFSNKISEIYRRGETSESLVDTLFFYFGPSMHYIIVVKLSIFVHEIYRRFRYLNDEVVPKISALNGLMYKHGKIVIYDVRYLHAKLCESSEILMGIYGPWLILWFCVTTNAVSQVVFAHPDASMLPKFALPAIWLVALCCSCGLASDEANKISQRLIERRVSSREANDTVDRIEMALYLCNHELRFTAMRVYAINRSFLLAILSMILSYMTFISSK